MIRIYEKNIYNFFEYIIACCMILQCNSIWIKQDKFNVIILIMLMISIIALDLFLYKRKNLKFTNIKKRNLIYILFINVFIIMYMFSYQPFLKQYILYFFIAINSISFLKLYEIEMKNAFTICFKIKNIVNIIAIVSLFFWIFGTILKIIPPSSQFLLDWGGEHYCNSYFNLYFEAQKIKFRGIELYRNTGIFAEGPMYSFILCFSLSVESFLCATKSWKNIMIYVFAIISTVSTTGIIVILLIFTFKILSVKIKTKFLFLIKSLIIAIWSLIAVFIGMHFIYEKIGNRDMSKASSYSVRVSDIMASFDAWKDNIIFGVGYNNQEKIKLYNSMSGNGSSGIFSILAQGGIYLTMFYLISFIGLYYSLRKNNKNDILFFLFILIFLLFFTNIPYTYIYQYIILSGYLKSSRYCIS